MQYSHSKLETYENCPLCYKYRYIDKIRSDKEGVEAFMGKRVHEALEKLYRDVQLSAAPTLDELLAFYDDEWEKNWHENVAIVRSDYCAEDYRETGRSCVRDYYNRYSPFDQGRTLWIERRIKVPLDTEEAFPFIGVADRLVEKEDGYFELHDYKTSGTCPDQEKIDSDRQLALYQLAVEAAYPDAKEVRLVWHYLVFDKTFESSRTREQLEQVKDQALALIREIEATEKFEERESALCDWCGYRDICPKQKHPSAVQEMSPKAFIEDEGVQLANRYAELKAQEGELNALIEQARADVIAYCEQHSVENVRGSDRMVSVKFAPSASFPKAGTADREQLEKALREMDALDDFLTLDIRALSKAFLGGRWGDDCAALKPLVEIDEHACRVSTKKLREEE